MWRVFQLFAQIRNFFQGVPPSESPTRTDDSIPDEPAQRDGENFETDDLITNEPAQRDRENLDVLLLWVERDQEKREKMDALFLWGLKIAGNLRSNLIDKITFDLEDGAPLFTLIRDTSDLCVEMTLAREDFHTWDIDYSKKMLIKMLGWLQGIYESIRSVAPWNGGIDLGRPFRLNFEREIASLMNQLEEL